MLRGRDDARSRPRNRYPRGILPAIQIRLAMDMHDEGDLDRRGRRSMISRICKVDLNERIRRR